MIFKALKDFDIDLKHSFIIGDKPHDIQLGKNVGCMAIKINNYSKNEVNFNDAVNIILKGSGGDN